MICVNQQGKPASFAGKQKCSMWLSHICHVTEQEARLDFEAVGSVRSCGVTGEKGYPIHPSCGDRGNMKLLQCRADPGRGHRA